MRTSKVTHKHGFELLTSVSHTKKLDEKNCSPLWIDEINREIENLKNVFDVLEDEAKIPVSCNKSSNHLVLDARMTLEFKSR